MVRVAVAMTPSPIFFLLIRGQSAEVAIGIPMPFRGPLIIMSNFITVPSMVVAVIRVINSVIATFATSTDYRTSQHSRQ